MLFQAVRQEDRISVYLYNPIVGLVAPICLDLLPDLHEGVDVRIGTPCGYTGDRPIEKCVPIALENAQAIFLHVLRKVPLGVPERLRGLRLPCDDRETEERCPLNSGPRWRWWNLAGLARASDHSAIPRAGWRIDPATRKVCCLLVACVTLARCEFHVAQLAVAAFCVAAIVASIRTLNHRRHIWLGFKHCMEQGHQMRLLHHGATIGRIELVFVFNDLRRGAPGTVAALVTK
mmetsp:Transcript_80725/g.172651  ORF Transcript_80725/g.172651 Transcript_80725/m.172651 type:complete len:233 (+) Transcript_80725:410-1108(+)